jgi:hypothetical protein
MQGLIEVFVERPVFSNNSNSYPTYKGRWLIKSTNFDRVYQCMLNEFPALSKFVKPSNCRELGMLCKEAGITGKLFGLEISIFENGSPICYRDLKKPVAKCEQPVSKHSYNLRPRNELGKVCKM